MQSNLTFRRRALLTAAAVMLLGTGASACGGGGSGSDASDASTTAAPTDDTSSTAAETTAAASTSTDAEVTTTTEAPGLADASEAQRSAPGDGTGTALLKAVRVGRNEGFERIVYEFQGTSVPGYRIQWVDGPITADGSGEPVEVKGSAYLEMIMEPASGVDLSGTEFKVVYEGDDRIAVAGQTELITDLVRTGDFEAVLSWAAGTTERVPFRVLTMSSPTRIVIDLETP